MSAEDNKKKNKKIIGGFCLIVIIIFAFVLLTGNNTTDDKEHIIIKELDFDRFGYVFDRTLYGTIDGTTDNGTNHTYYVTKDQMASLYYGNNKSLEYPDGVLLTYHKLDNGADTWVVDKLYYPNGTEIPRVSGEESDVFAANSVQIGQNFRVCNSEFGMTTSET